MAREPQRVTGLCWVVHVNITVFHEKHILLLNRTKMLSLLYFWPTPSVLLADLPNAAFPLASTHPLGIYWSLYVHTHLSYAYKCWSACPGIWGCCWLHLFREEQEETVKYPRQAWLPVVGRILRLYMTSCSFWRIILIGKLQR